MSKANYNLICKPDNLSWVETCGFDVGHAFGILALVVLVDFPWVETHGYNIGHAYGIVSYSRNFSFSMKSVATKSIVFTLPTGVE